MSRRPAIVDGLWLLCFGLASTVWCLTAAAELGATFDEPKFTEAPPPFDYGRTVGMVDAVAAQHRFQLDATVELPAFGGRVSVWRLVR